MRSSTPEFEHGLRDRTLYENWVGGLLGAAKVGAKWWEGNRSLASKSGLNCYNQDPTPDFIAGCSQAQMMLNPFDRRRLAEPEYRAGWNSY